MVFRVRTGAAGFTAGAAGGCTTGSCSCRASCSGVGIGVAVGVGLAVGVGVGVAVTSAFSSISVTAIDYNVVREEEAKKQGLLDGITWDEYKAMNQERTKLEIDEDLVDLVAKASGISAENISFVAYEEPMYIDAEALPVTATDIVQIVLIVLILGLLAFVIFRSMRSEKVIVEEEKELSIEELLDSAPEAAVEELEVETKSETRKMIEKFVDDNPEAAANLLRNWLNEDWG